MSRRAYDGVSAPEPAAWQALEEEERLDAVREAHPSPLDGIHDGVRNVELHLRMHVVIEDQIATGVPPETARALARLEEAGLRRHPATHMLIEAFAATLQAVMGGAPFEAEWPRRLAALDPSAYIANELRRRHR